MVAVRAGQRLPNTRLAEIVGTELTTIETDNLLSGQRSILIGIPGAFTPTCSERHIPQFVTAADSLKAAGYGLIACIMPNDPWVVKKFAQVVDPAGKLRLLSDGNLELVRKCGLTTLEEAYFMGLRSARYVLTVNNAVVERVNVDPTILSMSCTGVRDVLEV